MKTFFKKIIGNTTVEPPVTLPELKVSNTSFYYTLYYRLQKRKILNSTQ